MSIQTKKYISKKTGKTETRYYAAVWDSTRERTIWSKGYKKKSEAKTKEANLLKALEDDTILYDTLYFKDLAELWFTAKKKTYSDSTYRGYRYYYNHYIAPVFSEQKTEKILSKHLVVFVNELNKKYSSQTVNKIINLLSMMFKYALSPLHVINKNPALDISRSRIDDVRHTTWNEQQIMYFFELAYVKESLFYAPLLLAFATGARPGEICGLAESDLKKEHVLTLNRGLNRYGNISDLKTKRSHRPLKLSNDLYEIVYKALKAKKKCQLRGLIDRDNDFLFVNDDGQPIRPDQLSKAFKRLVRRNNKEYNADNIGILLPDIRLYDARHSFATNLMIAGKKIKVVSEVMGSSVRTVLSSYSHVTATMHDEALEDYAEKIFSAKSV